jgi:hypothetical protein
MYLQIKDAEGLASEVSRLRKGGEQLASVLAELEQVRGDGRRQLEAKERELQAAQKALAACEAERQAASTRAAVVEAEVGQLEARVRSCEEARWRVGMDLANAKAELDWRAKADQDRDLFAQGMKEELERVKGRLMRSEMRKLKLEESLEEALLELRGRKREIEQVKARVDSLVRMLQVLICPVCMLLSPVCSSPLLLLTPPRCSLHSCSRCSSLCTCSVSPVYSSPLLLLAPPRSYCLLLPVVTAYSSPLLLLAPPRYSLRTCSRCSSLHGLPWPPVCSLSPNPSSP